MEAPTDITAQTDTVVRPVRDVDAEALGRVHATCWHETYDHLISKAALENVSPKRLAELWTHWAQQGPSSRCSPPSSAARSSASPDRARRATATLRARASSTSSTCSTSSTAPASGSSCSTPPSTPTRRLYLWVAEDNPRAHRFYARNGFTLDGATHTEPFLGETLTEVRFVR
jgi:GNAT superfamily N-acetyltransferase